MDNGSGNYGSLDSSYGYVFGAKRLDLRDGGRNLRKESGVSLLSQLSRVWCRLYRTPPSPRGVNICHGECRVLGRCQSWVMDWSDTCALRSVESVPNAGESEYSSSKGKGN